MRYFIVLISLLLINSLFSQDTIVFTASVKDKNFTVIPYSNVGIKNRPETHTVADKEGYFEIDCLLTDTLVIRQAGYKKVEQCVRIIVENETFQLQKTIILAEKIQEVKEVTITSKKRKIRNKNFGNESEDKAFTLEVESDKLGYEFGVKINIPEKKRVKLEQFNCFIVQSSVDSFKFRLNIYNYSEMDSSLNLLSDNIIGSDTLTSGAFNIDLKHERLYVKGDILVTLEVIEFFGEGKVTFSTGTISGGTYFREGKEADWEKFPIIGLAFNVDAKVSRR